MPPEMKREVLTMLDRLRAAAEKEDQEEIQAIIIDGLALVIQIMGKDTGILPIVVMELLP